MAPNLIPSAKLTLSYPLYTCDFDPTDSTKLVVGGGGGAGRSGVGNRIVCCCHLVAEIRPGVECDLDNGLIVLFSVRQY